MKKANVFIILCLVVIIVSVAVIAYSYLNACTFIPTHPREELRITGVTFQTGNATISVRNVGVKASSISRVMVDDVTKTVLATGGYLTGSGPYDLDPGESGTITISLSWTSGNNYTFAVITTKGWKVAYRATAP